MGLFSRIFQTSQALAAQERVLQERPSLVEEMKAQANHNGMRFRTHRACVDLNLTIQVDLPAAYAIQGEFVSNGYDATQSERKRVYGAILQELKRTHPSLMTRLLLHSTSHEILSVADLGLSETATCDC